MIVESLQTVVAEVNGLWSWIAGIIAGWGLTFTAVVAGIVYAHIRIARLNKKITTLENRVITEGRDVSLRLTKVEK
jgi:uncharacterized membrane protein YciS (DUF1049 family)